MKIRLTLGNVIGAVALGAGWVAGHTAIISSVIPAKISGPLVAIAGVILLISKNITSSNTENIPTEQKAVDNSILTVQKTLVK